MHFGVIMGIAVVFTLPQCNSWFTLLASTLFASLPALFSLTVFIYFPSFFSSFLPKLEAILGEQEKLASQAEETKKCKRTQFQADTAEISKITVQQIENAKYSVTLDTLISIAEALNLPLKKLVDY
jgi:DNA-binding XRE family transcriptional regulator